MRAVGFPTNVKNRKAYDRGRGALKYLVERNWIRASEKLETGAGARRRYDLLETQIAVVALTLCLKSRQAPAAVEQIINDLRAPALQGYDLLDSALEIAGKRQGIVVPMPIQVTSLVLDDGSILFKVIASEEREIQKVDLSTIINLALLFEPLADLIAERESEHD